MLFGRVFFGVYYIVDIENFICEKIMKKIFRVNKLFFLSNIVLRYMDMGDVVFIFINFKFKDFIVEGECVIEVDVWYIGNFWGEVVVIVKFDFG